MHAYPFDPTLWFTLPQWVIEPLVEHLSAIEALDLQAAITAQTAPYWKAEEREAFMANLAERTRVFYGPAERTPRLVRALERHPDQARAILAAAGAQLTKGSGDA